jgi:glycosyltransferase involved in cell wall biosynthesis
MSAPVTIVLPTFDRRHVLERTWWCYAELARVHPMLVIDDGSHDGTCAWLRGLGATVVRRPRRRGLPAARNLGLRLATTPWVLFGEDDVLFAPGHIEALLAAAARLPRVGAVAGRLFAGETWTLPAARPANSAARLLDPVNLLGDFAAPLAVPQPLPSLHACALVDRRLALADSAFREESDLYARLWRAGRGCWLVPDTWAMHVRHRLGGGCRGRDGLGAKLLNRVSYWRNASRYARHHLPLWRRWGAGGGAGEHSARWAWRVARAAWQAWERP